MEHLTQPEIDHLLTTQPVAHVGVIDGDVPYVTPVSFVYYAGAIWFRTAEGRRLNALREAPHTCVEVTRYHQYTGMWESVIGWGNARLHTDPSDQLRVADLLEEKYRDPLEALAGIPIERTDEESLFAVEILLDEVTGRASMRPGGRRVRPGRL
ncbi:MAG: pyridoxamine 5'-phosphate oxidase family protein [Acidimicrobiia bacterium]|nr:pyridoxamine 5'-phosphate oxidase family protein [Acidimicrobiia bacterium]